MSESATLGRGERPYAEAEALLRDAYDKLREREPDPLVSAARHLVRCAIDVVAVLGRPGSSGAEEILGCARAAVTVATYAVREADGRHRRAGHPGRG
ncbi:hypothetical protein [Nocardia sp. BMG51109]|uniref:hypothetical protein n=1 Tax=Nocardia sp. BMG51109 TaxID=1056816 RepID=UPI000465A607|nr:hypothetical protein [Nocardia sp. BMG51109]